jgi:hypothetical protein
MSNKSHKKAQSQDYSDQKGKVLENTAKTQMKGKGKKSKQKANRR